MVCGVWWVLYVGRAKTLKWTMLVCVGVEHRGRAETIATGNPGKNEGSGHTGLLYSLVFLGETAAARRHVSLTE